ncbi:uro-adherence factor A [Chironomus tepperi]|uniref:uro-adherence factor A n=1 Tax=Chironomus tepperi TaxID=113505 RepID=UPI00391F79D1
MDSKVETKEESKDEVDFIQTSTAAPAKKEICVSCKSFNPLKKGFLMRNSTNNNNNHNQTTPKTSQAKKTSVECELQTAVKSHISALERLNLFHFPLRKKSLESSDDTGKSSNEQNHHRPRLIKSSSIARLFGNTYNTKKSEQNNTSANPQLKKSQSVSEKFSNRSNESDEEFVLRISEHNVNLSTSTSNLSLELGSAPMEKPTNKNAIKSITKGLGKLLRRNHSSVEISPPDPEYKVLYLGNVLTGWAKGDACIEKPLATLWRNYTQNNKPEVLMRLRVCPSGLKATTKQHGLTEYWSHRITFCLAPRTYPKIFCWIYRHEGRKLKHELRCHAVICSREALCEEIASQLKQNLAVALREFKRDKINKQNARLSLANAADENPSMPRRKILLSTGANNYRPPLERSKSAPKLFAIEEMVDEEDEEESNDETKAKKLEEKKKREEMKSCCKEDHLYPSVTLGRRRCRRGHSIRKSRLLRGTIFTQQKSYPPTYKPSYDAVSSNRINQNELINECDITKSQVQNNESTDTTNDNPVNCRPLGSDEDFESFLLCNNYDSKEPLTSDLMSYFEMKLQTPTSTAVTTTNSLLTTTATASMSDLLNDDLSLRNQRTCMSMSDLIDYQSDNELEDNESDIYFNQDSLLDTLRRQSTKTVVDIDDDDNQSNSHQTFIHDTANKQTDDDFETTNDDNCDYRLEPTHHHHHHSLHHHYMYKHHPTHLEFDDDLTSESPSSLCMSEKTICVNLDSDEGSSISSGCETSSTVTTNAEENQIPRRGSVLDRVRTFERMSESKIIKKDEKNASGKVFHRSLSNGSTPSANFILSPPENNAVKITRGGTLTRADNINNGVSLRKVKIDDDSDELSDESGYVEFQDLSLKSTYA